MADHQCPVDHINVRLDTAKPCAAGVGKDSTAAASLHAAATKVAFNRDSEQLKLDNTAQDTVAMLALAAHRPKQRHNYMPCFSTCCSTTAPSARAPNKGSACFSSLCA